MAQNQVDEAKFKDIYERPSIQRMLDELNPYQFEDFIGYVFTRAGFTVEDTATQYGPGLDLKLYATPTAMKRLFGGVSVKQYHPPEQKVLARDVTNLRGGLAPIGGVPGFIVTTSTLNDHAVTQALRDPRVYSVDGDNLLRYITYVRGTRSTPKRADEPRLIRCP